MKHLVNTFVLLVGIALAAGTAQAAEPEKIEAASAATLEWLSLTDSAQYGASWDSASALFRNAISREGWAASLAAARDPLGALESRERASAQFATTLPGAPDGEYVVLQFSSSFENKDTAIETVTAMKDADGHWRVAGYFIK